jgi:non-canonical poly(A) RNA polymerase PAPD5/7
MLVLREAFCRHRICTQEGIQLINGATVPIIKLTDRKTDVKVDMSFNMNNGLRSAQLIGVGLSEIEFNFKNKAL